MMHRVFYKCETELSKNTYGDSRTIERRYPCEASEANLISSHVTNSTLHAPTLDIDFEARLVPSSTPGHYHLFLDKAMTWRRYRRLLRALAKAGVIEKGFYEMALKRDATFLRSAPTKGLEGDKVLPPEYTGVKRLVKAMLA